MQNITNPAKNGTIVLGFPRVFVRFAAGGCIAAGNIH